MSPTPDIPCPDTRQAVADLRGTVAELLDRGAKLSRMDERQAGYLQERRALGDLNARVRLRAERLAIQPATLLALVQDDLNARVRRGRPKPVRVTPITLKDDIAQALQRVDSAAAAKAAAIQEEAEAADHLAAMIQRAQSYGQDGLPA
ncbi:hypothetical protein [Sphingomonas sp. ABOLF]|uniref:hypothetical protein n=1 Tax=Sphingomonas sp. ABOLF TaxID=1985879 RepID=UPI000F7F7ADE|nr:hypothetical protein [Sphingomonas sp. ABOLF]